MAETTGGNGTVDRYFEEIAKLPLLSQKETVKLIGKIRRGDEGAREKLINSNLKLVVYLAKRYRGGSGMPFEDLIQEGNCGLLRAVKGFDCGKGYKFSTYSGQAIERAIARAIVNCTRIIKVPEGMQGKMRKIFKAEVFLEQENGGRISVGNAIRKISKITGLKSREIKEAKSSCYSFISFQQPVGFDNDGSFEDFPLDENGDLVRSSSRPESVFNSEAYRRSGRGYIKKAIEDALTALPRRQESVIRMYFGFNRQSGMNLAQIGEKLGVTREYVRQTKEKALGKLRKSALKHLVK